MLDPLSRDTPEQIRHVGYIFIASTAEAHQYGIAG
jgi:hypothetical protein